MGNRTSRRTKKQKETPRTRSLKHFRSKEQNKAWHTFQQVNNSELNCMDANNNNLLSLVPASSITSIKERVGAVNSWVDFGSIFADFSTLLLTIPLPPQRLPSLNQAEMDLERELFSVFVPAQHLPSKKDAISPRKTQIKDGLHARIVGKKFHVIEELLNTSCQRLVDAASVDAVALMNDGDSWEEIIDTAGGGATKDQGEAEDSTTCTTKKRNLVPSDLLKCASSRTLAGGDSYFVVQEIFSTNKLLVTPSHSESQGAIEIMIFDSGVVSIRTKSVFDIRSVEEMDGKEMVEIFVEHVMNVDLFQNCMRRHLLIESPSSKLAVDLSDMMGL
jgi:hypothetical protein